MNWHWVVFAGSLLYSLTAGAAVPREVGQTAFVKGKVLALHPDLEQRELTQPKQGLFLKDRVETGDMSFSVLEFLDRAKVSVRPLSQFSVEDYVLEERKVRFSFEQGGVEVQMGEIGQDNPDQLVLQTPTAEISAQQGHLRVRLCGEDCAQEELKHGSKDIPLVHEVVARIIEVAGKVVATGRQGDRGTEAQGRLLALGAPLYRQDSLTSDDGSRAMLLFRDGGRVSLGANSAMEIKDYRWQEPGHESHFALRLLRGGLRSMTGMLGQSKPQAMGIETPVGLVGIRGTVFDLLLAEPEADSQPVLYSYVHQGEVELTDVTAEPKVLRENQGSRLQQGAAESIEVLPGDEALIGSDPQKAQVDLVADFGRHALAGAPSGLYIYAVDGHVRIKGQLGPWSGRILHLGRGEAAYVDSQGALMRLDRPRAFQLQDELGEESLLSLLPVAAVAAAAALPPPSPPSGPGTGGGPQIKPPPVAPPEPTRLKKPPPPPPVAKGCPPGTTWNKGRKSCVAKTAGCPAGHYYSKRHGRCLAKAATSTSCPAGTFYSKRYGGCVRKEKQDSGTSTAVKAAVGAAIAVGIINAISGGRGGGHSRGGGYSRGGGHSRGP